MTGKGFSVFDECVSRCVRLSPQEEESVSLESILSFVLSRKIINIYNDIARKYGYGIMFKCFG